MERLINLGVSSLSNEELISIIIRAGVRGESVKVLATNILSRIDDITELKNISYESLIKIRGIGKTKACILIAVIELAKRINHIIPNISDMKITSSDLVYKYYKDRIGEEKQEFFFVIYLIF